MKKIKFLLVLLLALLIIPFAVYADEGEENASEGSEETTEVSKEVPIYFFRGEGCPHCQEAEEWFSSIEEEYGQYFVIKDYETWYNTDNADLMSKVEEARGEEAGGVPYIIIGDKSWIGFAEDYEDEIISQIQTVYSQDINARYDIMKLIDNGNTKKSTEKKSVGGDVIALIVIVVVCIGIALGINFARKNTD